MLRHYKALSLCAAVLATAAGVAVAVAPANAQSRSPARPRTEIALYNVSTLSALLTLGSPGLGTRGDSLISPRRMLARFDEEKRLFDTPINRLY